jgi:hypothetical protein
VQQLQGSRGEKPSDLSPGARRLPAAQSLQSIALQVAIALGHQ